MAGQVEVKIRRLRAGDWAGVWAILEPIFRAGETYALSSEISEEDARRTWTDPPNEVFVAVDETEGELLGTYYLRPNHDGPGDHVCNCGYAVSVSARGRGVASLMCRHSQQHGAASGFRAMQFNLVAASNEAAVRLWGGLGFEIVGTLPGAFRHPRLGFVDAYVMFKPLETAAGSRVLRATTRCKILDTSGGWRVGGSRDKDSELEERYIELEIHGDGHSGYHLVMSPAGRCTADTWHESVRDALLEARERFSVEPDEWRETGPVRSDDGDTM